MATRTKVLRGLARTGIIGALYALLTIFLAPISYGPLQFRISEAMAVLPILFPEAVVGLTVGCLIANVFSAYGWYDIVFGTLATLIASVLTYLTANKIRYSPKLAKGMPFFAAFPPVIVNALLLPIIWYMFMGDVGYWLNFAMLLGTQTAVIYAIGIPLYLGIKKTGLHLK